MPEQAGSGAAVFDFNKDGLLDIYLIQCGGPKSSSANRLFEQQPGFVFKDVSAGSGLDVTGFGMGVATGDINNDSWTDLVLTEYGRTRLFLNDSGKFKEITSEAGIDNPRWATAVSFLDFDRDGLLDLFVANYLDYNPTEKCVDSAGAREYCGPQSFPGTVSRLFRNAGVQPSGLPRFDDVTVRSGLVKASGPALGTLCADFNGDHWPDIFISDDGRPNRLFINQQDGTFTEEALVRGVAFTGMGSAAANMGVAVGDVNRDGLFDFFVTHLVTEQHTLWIQGPAGLFLDQTAMLGLGTPRWKGTGFGAVLTDLDHDGWLDLAFVNGAVRRAEFPGARLERLNPFWFPYAQRNQLFLGNGAGKFLDVSDGNLAFCGKAGVGRALVTADVDTDGDIDFLVTNTGGPAQLFRNIAPKRGNWILVRALDPAAGERDALGAEIIVQAGQQRFWRLVQTSFSYLSASDPRVHVGLGAATAFDKLQVIWPDGSSEVFPGGPANREITLRKGSGKKT